MLGYRPTAPWPPWRGPAWVRNRGSGFKSRPRSASSTPSSGSSRDAAWRSQARQPRSERREGDLRIRRGEVFTEPAISSNRATMLEPAAAPDIEDEVIETDGFALYIN